MGAAIAAATAVCAAARSETRIEETVVDRLHGARRPRVHLYPSCP